jgi:hypothetical protein
VESVEPIQQMLTEVIEFNKHQQQYKVDTFWTASRYIPCH